MPEFTFVTVWRIRAPCAAVWAVISDFEAWPKWWKGVERVDVIDRGRPDRVGFRASTVWKSVLPYRLHFVTTVVTMDPEHLIHVTAEGQLKGHGRMTFTSEGGTTIVRYEWTVVTTTSWMNLLIKLLPWVARPVFAWNHDVIMRWGGTGLAGEARGELLSSSEAGA